MSTLLQDLRFGVRSLRKRWMITGLAVLSLALAIGGNGAVFSMVDAFLFRPLPYPEPDRIVLIGERRADQPELGGNLGTSLPSYVDWRERSQLVEQWGALQPATFGLRGPERSEPVTGVRVAGDLFELLDARPIRGRTFSAVEMVEGGPKVALLGYDFWIDRYGADTDPVGEVLTLSGEPHEVIGVLPQGFEFLTAGQNLWVPLARSPESAPRDRRTLLALGRLRPGATMQQVRAEAAGIATDLETEHPDAQRGWTADVYNLRYDIPNAQSRMLFAILQGSVLLVLVIACVNITNLLLARGQERSREIALRTVLGAGRGRIVRQLLTESSLMVALGALGGLGLAALGVRLMSAQFVGVLPSTWVIQLDMRVVGFTLGIAVLAGILFGTVPALQTFRQGQAETLKEGGGRGGSGRSRKTLSRALVIGEIALSFVALGGGSLLVRSFVSLQGADPGFEAGPILTATLSVPTSRYPGDEDRVLLQDRILESARALGSVEGAAVASALPQAPFAPSDSFLVGDATSGGTAAPRAIVVQASPEYVDVLDIDVLRGRFFDETDRADAAPVAVVSQSLARERFGDGSPLGARIVVRGTSREVVGVVADVQQVLVVTGQGASGETIYLPAAQEPQGNGFLVIRSRGNPAELGEPLRDATAAIDPDLALAQVLTMEEYVAQFFVGVAIFNTVLGGFGLIALLLASLGTYGVLSYSVSRRGHEIGIRMALGAEGPQVVRMFAKQGMWLGVIGLGLGILMTLPLVGLLRSLLQGLTTVEPTTLVLIAAVLFGVTMVASFVPAGRASAVDPMRTLRDD